MSYYLTIISFTISITTLVTFSSIERAMVVYLCCYAHTYTSINCFIAIQTKHKPIMKTTSPICATHKFLQILMPTYINAMPIARNMIDNAILILHLHFVFNTHTKEKVLQAMYIRKFYAYTATIIKVVKPKLTIFRCISKK